MVEITCTQTNKRTGRTRSKTITVPQVVAARYRAAHRSDRIEGLHYIYVRTYKEVE